MQSANVLRFGATENQLKGLMTKGESGLGGGVYFGPQMSMHPTRPTHQNKSQMGNDAGLPTFPPAGPSNGKMPFNDQQISDTSIAGVMDQESKVDVQKQFLDVQHPPGSVGYWEAYV